MSNTNPGVSPSSSFQFMPWLCRSSQIRSSSSSSKIHFELSCNRSISEHRVWRSSSPLELLSVVFTGLIDDIMDACLVHPSAANLRAKISLVVSNMSFLLIFSIRTKKRLGLIGRCAWCS